jgi:hypothetical protein
LNGGTGADGMTGGDGSDIDYVDSASASDAVVETNATASTGGSDTVYSSLEAYTLSDNVENGRILATGVAALTGNGLNNTLYDGDVNATGNIRWAKNKISMCSLRSSLRRTVHCPFPARLEFPRCPRLIHCPPRCWAWPLFVRP